MDSTVCSKHSEAIRETGRSEKVTARTEPGEAIQRRDKERRCVACWAVSTVISVPKLIDSRKVSQTRRRCMDQYGTTGPQLGRT